MKSLLIDFTKELPVLRFDATTDNFKAVVQKGLVNIATKQGSDRLYTDRGTTLLADAVQSGFIDVNAAQHSANFAANDTLFFLRGFTQATDVEAVESVTLTAAEYSGNSVTFDAVFVSASNETIGVTTTV